jgi:hypothetical protein
VNYPEQNLMSEPQAPKANQEADATSDLCQEVLALIPAYSVGATDPAETAFVKRYLAECPEAVAELREYQGLSEAMLLNVNLQRPRDGLEKEIMAVLAKAAPESATARRARQVEGIVPRDWSGRVGRLVAAAAIVLLIFSNLLWWREVSRVRDEKAETAAQLDASNTLLASLGLGADTTRRIELFDPQDSMSVINAALIWEAETRTALLYAQNFPPLSPEMAYQVWLIRGEDRISPGVFHVNEEGVGVFIFSINEPLTDYEAIGITPEPVPGSPDPTAPPVAVGRIL